MTEQEWLECDRPHLILKHIRRRTSDRKLRLYVCNWYRLFFANLDEVCITVVETTERFADGLASRKEFLEARRKLYRTIPPVSPNADSGFHDQVARDLLDTMLLKHLPGWEQQQAVGTSHTCSSAELSRISLHQKHLANCQLNMLHCIFGNPFRPVVLNPDWLTTTVKTLAATFYDERQFDKMPFLGDALEDAGCNNQVILKHCRVGGEHVRGCFVLDLVLGRN
jgi:hypothetical protein